MIIIKYIGFIFLLVFIFITMPVTTISVDNMALLELIPFDEPIGTALNKDDAANIAIILSLGRVNCRHCASFAEMADSLIEDFGLKDRVAFLYFDLDSHIERVEQYVNERQYRHISVYRSNWSFAWEMREKYGLQDGRFIPWVFYFDSMGNLVRTSWGAQSKDDIAEFLYAVTGVDILLTATPTASRVLVNGKEVSFDAYNINYNNYFKLRDIAYILNGTEKQFEIEYDSMTRAITLTSGKAYTAVGGEMAGKRPGDKTPAPSVSEIYLDGEKLHLTVYTIDGNNYFKLRDLGAALNFGVDWDGANNTILIDTSKGYT
jgi:hypothetical protein